MNPSFKSQATRAPKIDREYEYFPPIKQNLCLMGRTREWRRHAVVTSRGARVVIDYLNVKIHQKLVEKINAQVCSALK